MAIGSSFSVYGSLILDIRPTIWQPGEQKYWNKRGKAGDRKEKTGNEYKKWIG
jgi:hypothetical protein